MERIYVTVRARPLSPEDSKTSPWRICGNSISLANQPTKFDCDRIFGDDCKTVDVYEARTKEIVASAVRGFNGTVFAYGQTSSGKTHTMRGSVAEPGIIPLAVYDLFKSIREDVDREFLVRMSYMEIYNEEINDLLAPEHRKLQIHENVERGIYVAGLREEIVASPEQVLDFMEFGESHRHIGETNMNLYSSRSHTIFRMIVESRAKTEDGGMDNSCDAVRVSVLNLVDLAGSERAAKTGAEGMRLKEGSHINKSLLTLGTVIKKLSESAESQGGHVPYRDSKLTRILQPALGGNSNTAIICNITLAQVHTDETKSTLMFASRALRVTNCACVNEILTDAALLRRQRKEIEELRAKLMSSHSEHFGEEILNLRNTLLQSELEKERIALELEEEKKAKAHRERRLLEQAKKIANLSSLVLCSERDETNAYPSKNKRRVTWCPGPVSLKSKNEVFSLHKENACGQSRRERGNMGPLPLFEELIQNNVAPIDGPNSTTCLSHSAENKDHVDDFSLPDAGALLRVTSRRKVHLQRTDSLLENLNSVENQSENGHQTLLYDVQKKSENIEFKGLINMLAETECTPNRRSSSSMCLVSETSCGRKNLTTRESEAILLIKQLEDKIKTLEIEKAFIQRNLDNVVDLATQQNASFRETCEELNREVLNEREKAKVANEERCSVSNTEALQEEVNAFSSIKLSSEIEGLAMQFDDSRIVIDDMFSVVEDHFHNFNFMSEILQEVKEFARHDLVQLKSIVDGHKKLESGLEKRNHELESEKNLLTTQSVDHQKQIQELMSKLDNLEKSTTQQVLQHDLEKDGLLCQILNLQKEVSCLSSSSLTREKESLRKELDRTKTKLKDAESKLKNTIQDKIKLESERAQAEREIKHLHSQRAILERDMLKRESLIDKRHETKSSDYSKTKGAVGGPEQTLQEDYQKLEVHAFEMEAKVASLNEAYINAIRHMEEAFARNGILESELEDMSTKLNITDSEILLLKEELTSNMQKLEASESFCKKLESTISLLSREKEEMAMQLTDALLEVEAEKSTWLAKEKTFTESNERLMIFNDEIDRLSNDLSEARNELDSCREQCRLLKESLSQSEEIAEREKEYSTSKSLEIAQLRNGLQQNMVSSVQNGDVMSKSEELLSECHHGCEGVKKLQEQLIILTQQKDNLSEQVKKISTESDLPDDYQNLKSQLLITTREKDDLLRKNKDMKAVLAELNIPKEKYEDMLSAARINVEEMSKRISNMEVKMHDEAVHKDKETAKLRMRVRSMQAKLDAFRGRYEQAMDEITLMNNKFEEASGKLKKQLGSYGVEILRLKKELASKE